MSAMPAFPIIETATGGALIASPSTVLREQVLHSLNGRWRPVEHAKGGAEALAKLGRGNWQVLFLDRRIPDLDTGELIAIIQQRFSGLQVVLLDSDAEFPVVDEGESFQQDAGLRGPRVTSETSCRSGEVRECKYEPLPGMIGRSEAMQRVYQLAQLVAPRSTSVLIVGPTGSGKELVARALHRLSPRVAKPFVAVNCAAIPEALLESELFGHARGAFTGAVQPQPGRISAAHGGTLFLDEVGELPFGTQAKLLRFLDQKEVQRLGTAEVTRVDVRVIAASNVDLAGRAGKGEFREDLFYRLSVFPLELPPLAERRADIVPLAEHFLACVADAMSGPCPLLSEEAVRILEGHSWKGNVRELQHVMERAAILLEKGTTVLTEHLYFPFQQSMLQSGGPTLSCTGRGS
ncbi:MAG TPA: sigma-54 dependent transcriptional regulator [Candidatus Acidoferrum sp.]|nr:sigma-54 dependent transcriptional regulator [Candidatus Acidoferrum sp.]